MTNIKKLIKLIEEMNDGEFKDSLLECAANVEEDQQELVDEVDSLKGELDDANVEIDNLQDEEPAYNNTIELGLDTIHFKFEKDNLQIRQQFDSLMQVLCKTPNAVI